MHSERLERVGQSVLAGWPIEQWRDVDLIVAVSGGPDSVALFRILMQAKQKIGGKGRIIVAHCNHQTRRQSEADACFVRELAEQHGVGHLQFDRPRSSNETASDPTGFERSDSASEESLREFRLESLLTAARQRGARYVVTGHTADDQIETILFRLCRGTGLAGLTGIPVARVVDGISIVRPLLHVHRCEIIELLDEIGQPWRIDESNLDFGYTRNFLRNEIIPRLAERFAGQFEQSVLGLARQAKEQIELLDRLTDAIVDSATISLFEQATVGLAVFAELPDVLVRHALTRIWSAAEFPQQAMSRKKWQQLAHLISAGSGQSIQLPGKISASIADCRLHLKQRAADPQNDSL